MTLKHRPAGWDYPSEKDAFQDKELAHLSRRSAAPTRLGNAVAWVSEASWITAPRARRAGQALAVLILAVIVLATAVYVQALLTDPTARPIALDFDAFWAAGRMAVQGHAASVYDNAAIERVERAAGGWVSGSTS